MSENPIKYHAPPFDLERFKRVIAGISAAIDTSSIDVARARLLMQASNPASDIDALAFCANLEEEMAAFTDAILAPFQDIYAGEINGD